MTPQEICPAHFALHACMHALPCSMHLHDSEHRRFPRTRFPFPRFRNTNRTEPRLLQSRGARSARTYLAAAKGRAQRARRRGV